MRERKHSHFKFWLIITPLLALAVLVIFGLGFFLSPQDKLQKADAIIVISGGQTTTRAQYGIELYKQGWSKNIIFSGAALDDGPSNAVAMQQQALEAGVPSKAILTDSQSKTTDQNAIYTKEILAEHGWRKIILVTSPYHQRRADMTFAHELGGDYLVLGNSSIESRWSKRFWWRPGFSIGATLDEVRKIVFIWATGQYQ